MPKVPLYVGQLFHRCFLKKINYANYSSASNDKFNLAYSYNGTLTGCSINKLKYNLTIASAAIIPTTFGLDYLAVTPAGSGEAIALLFGAMNICLYSVGQMFYKAVGKAYLNDAENTAKISYIGFFGQRVDVYIPVQEIHALEDSRRFFFTKFEYGNPVKCLKIQEKQVEYCDLGIARKLFGESFMR